MNKYLHFIAFLFPLICTSCDNLQKKQNKIPVLLADREAPLGWVYLKVYDDKSFEFILTGLRDKTIYPGIYRLNKDTIFFTYRDSVPKAGKTGIINTHSVSYIKGDYSENIEIKLNKLTK